MPLKLLLLTFAAPLAILPLQAQTSFRITPLHPIDQLRQSALKTQPPHEPGTFLPTDLVDLTRVDPALHLDIRYATANNFLSNPVYTQSRAFLQRPAAEAVLRADRELHTLGYGLVIHDGYRPWYVTKIFWDATPNAQKQFVANPKAGSRHNRGCAVDLSLYETSKPASKSRCPAATTR